MPQHQVAERLPSRAQPVIGGKTRSVCPMPKLRPLAIVVGLVCAALPQCLLAQEDQALPTITVNDSGREDRPYLSGNMDAKRTENDAQPCTTIIREKI
jgi:hypothetical protein